MQILKGIALGLMGFFLLISLSLLGLAFAINNTVLSPHFVTDALHKLDIISITRDFLVEQVPASDKPYAAAINNSLTEFEPWINQQTADFVEGLYAYLLGKTDDIDMTFSIEPLTQSLVFHYTQAFQRSPPAEYLKLPEVQKAQYLARSQQQLRDSIPFNSVLEINSDFLGADGMNILNQARKGVSYIRTIYIALIVLAVLFILFIILILREIKGTTRSLGIIFLIGGVLGYIFFFVIKQFIPGVFPSGDLPSQIQTWLPRITDDILFPWVIFNLVVLIIGAILLTVSFFVRGKQPVLLVLQ